MRQTSEVKDYLLGIATGEMLLNFSAATAAAARLAGFDEFFIINEPTSVPEGTPEPIKLPIRGKNLEVASTNDEIAFKYTANIATLSWNAWMIHYFGNPNFDFGSNPTDNAQTGAGPSAGTAHVFSSSNLGVVGRWFQLKDDTGKDLHNLTACTFAGTNSDYGVSQDATAMVEGVDYEIDLVTGMWRLLVAISDDTITPTFTSTDVAVGDSTYKKIIKPLELGVRYGFGVWRTFRPDGSVFTNHKDVQLAITPTGAMTYNGKYAEIPVEFRVVESGWAEVPGASY